MNKLGQFERHIIVTIGVSAVFGVVAGIYFRNPVDGLICFFLIGMLGVYGGVFTH